MKLQLLIILLLSIVSLYCCKAYLFYTSSHHNGANDDIDIYMQATRDYTGANVIRPKSYKNKDEKNVIKNILRDGHYEGLSLGFPGAYSHSEMNRPLVPYGCWCRKSTETGIYINLGSNILVEDRRQLFDLLKTPDRTDTYFCSKALQRGYTSIVTNNPQDFLDLGSEPIVCYGGCGTVRFNTTCPPGIKLHKGYHAIDQCNCSDTVGALNCDGRTTNHVMRQPENEITLDKNVCILDTDAIVYSTRALYTNVDLMINIYITIDLIINTTSDNHVYHHNISIDEIISDMKINDDASNTLLLNLQSIFLKATEEKSSLSLRKVNDSLVYTTSMDDHISNRKMIAINNTYIGVITSFKHTIYSAHHRWLLDDARCLKKLGAYLIILVGDFNYKVAEALMSRMHEYVDVIIGAHEDGDDSKLLTSSYYLHNHSDTSKYDNNTIMSPSSINPVELKGRILLFDKSTLSNHHHHQDQYHNNQEGKHYGRVHIEKTSNYQLMINRTV